MNKKKSILVLSSLAVTMLALGSCSNGGKANINDSVITVGASSTPHALILEQAREYIEGKGYTLDIKVMTDYVTPNISLNDGDLDANYFQHEPYLFDFNLNHGTDLIAVKKIHFEPMSIWVGKSNNGKIIIPNDKSNGDRARALLEKYGVGVGVGPIVEMEAQSIPLMLDDCSYACVNGNYALEADLIHKYNCYASESSLDHTALENANVVAVKRGNENAQAIRVLIDGLTQKKISDYMWNTFGYSVVPMF